jgi:competence protein ComEC
MSGAEVLLPGSGPVLGGIVGLVHRGLRAVLVWLDAWPATPLAVRRAPTLLLVGWGFSLFCLLYRRPGPGTAGAAVLVVGVAVWSSTGREPSVLVLDVGHGQAVVVRSANRTDLFDAGSMGDRGLGSGDFLRSLAAAGVEHLDGLFLSHGDADHARFAAALIERIEVAALYLSATSARRDRDSDDPAGVPGLLRICRARGVEVIALAAGDRIGPHRVLWPSRGRRFLATNDGSLVLETRIGQERILFPGDLEAYSLLECSRAMTEPATILLLPHHGNLDPSLPGLLERTRPLLAVASRGTPLDPGVRDWLCRSGSAFVSTARGGALAIPWHDGRAALERLARAAGAAGD